MCAFRIECWFLIGLLIISTNEVQSVSITEIELKNPVHGASQPIRTTSDRPPRCSQRMHLSENVGTSVCGLSRKGEFTNSLRDHGSSSSGRSQSTIPSAHVQKPPFPSVYNSNPATHPNGMIPGPSYFPTFFTPRKYPIAYRGMSPNLQLLSAYGPIAHFQPTAPLHHRTNVHQGLYNHLPSAPKYRLMMDEREAKARGWTTDDLEYMNSHLEFPARPEGILMDDNWIRPRRFRMRGKNPQGTTGFFQRTTLNPSAREFTPSIFKKADADHDPLAPNQENLMAAQNLIEQIYRSLHVDDEEAITKYVKTRREFNKKPTLEKLEDQEMIVGRKRQSDFDQEEVNEIASKIPLRKEQPVRRKFPGSVNNLGSADVERALVQRLNLEQTSRTPMEETLNPLPHIEKEGNIPGDHSPFLFQKSGVVIELSKDEENGMLDSDENGTTGGENSILNQEGEREIASIISQKSRPGSSTLYKDQQLPGKIPQNTVNYLLEAAMKEFWVGKNNAKIPPRTNTHSLSSGKIIQLNSITEKDKSDNFQKVNRLVNYSRLTQEQGCMMLEGMENKDGCNPSNPKQSKSLDSSIVSTIVKGEKVRRNEAKVETSGFDKDKTNKLVKPSSDPALDTKLLDKKAKNDPQDKEFIGNSDSSSHLQDDETFMKSSKDTDKKSMDSGENRSGSGENSIGDEESKRKMANIISQDLRVPGRHKWNKYKQLAEAITESNVVDIQGASMVNDFFGTNNSKITPKTNTDSLSTVQMHQLNSITDKDQINIFQQTSKSSDFSILSQGKVSIKVAGMANQNGYKPLQLNENQDNNFSKVSKPFKGKDFRGNEDKGEHSIFKKDNTKAKSMKTSSDIRMNPMDKNSNNHSKGDKLIENDESNGKESKNELEKQPLINRWSKQYSSSNIYMISGNRKISTTKATEVKDEKLALKGSSSSDTIIEVKAIKESQKKETLKSKFLNAEKKTIFDKSNQILEEKEILSKIHKSQVPTSKYEKEEPLKNRILDSNEKINFDKSNKILDKQKGVLSKKSELKFLGPESQTLKTNTIPQNNHNIEKNQIRDPKINANEYEKPNVNLSTWEISCNSVKNLSLLWFNFITKKNHIDFVSKFMEYIPIFGKPEVIESNQEPSINRNYENTLLIGNIIDGMEHVNKDLKSQESISMRKLQKEITLSEVFTLCEPKLKDRSPAKFLKPTPDKNSMIGFSVEDMESLSQVDQRIIISDWERKKLLKWPMVIFCYHLKLKNRYPHTPVETILADHSYNLLLHGWQKSHKNLAKVESECKTFLDDFEFTRRLFAFRRVLRRQTLALSWAHWKKGSNISRWDLLFFEFIYGLSDNPQEIKQFPLLRGNYLKSMKAVWNTSHPDMQVKDLLEISLGSQEAHERVNIQDYLIQRSHSKQWWDQVNLEKESMEFGIDILIVLKVGDALQLGSEFLVDGESLSILYNDLIEIMTDTTRPLPWIESPERAWLYRHHGRQYQRRLLELQAFVSSGAQKSRSYYVDSIGPALKKPTAILGNKVYRMGYELTWCDSGLNLEHLAGFWSQRTCEADEGRAKDFVKLSNQLSTKEKKALATWHSQYINLAGPCKSIPV